MIATAEPSRAQINLVAFSEPDRLLPSSWPGNHGTPRRSGPILHHIGEHHAKWKPRLSLGRHKA